MHSSTGAVDLPILI